ncbi:hypothetical protein RAC89_23010 [Paenibacillus sp. GD4]|uniref:hypothetical protein n=1 Tax=Paenibacillus sp. GD4 TaxID=3068890 RepID=UPI002796559C|nr:hypothetical protein [Paenibacillus sp. GD4]MDQ1913271.1 hypothetical protein [Paenibacillus sp. GD4]
MMKALGVDHEHQSLKLLHMQGNASATESKAADTLKGLLLQLGQSSDVTPALKEAAQQALQQITGQQLLLNTDRSSMFSHVTMFVPLINGNGEQTAAIHIQSRKGSRGGLDADNCRLVFDLKMKSLGDTMVDVQVVNKIVSLQVHNDQPFLADLLEANREEIANGLSAIGYQFISMKCTPYPERLSELNENSTAAIKPGSAAAQLQAVYGQKPYKGVDIRL